MSCRENGKFSQQKVKIWIENLSNVLLDPEACNIFKSYLSKNNFGDGELLVDFSEMCDRFLIKLRERHQDTPNLRKEKLDLEAR